MHLNLFLYFSGNPTILPFPYSAYPGATGLPWGMYPNGLFQQQNGTQSGSTTPVTSVNGTVQPAGARRPGSPGSSGGNTNGTVTPGPPELQNGSLTVPVSTANGMQPMLFPTAYIDPVSGAVVRGAAHPHPGAGAGALRLIQPQAQGLMMPNAAVNNVALASAAIAAAQQAQQPQTGLTMANGGSSGASRRESMDRGSSTFSPSFSEQYKNKAAGVNAAAAAAGAGWPNSYGALGTG